MADNNVTAQKGTKLDNPAPVDVAVDVTEKSVPAQVAQPRESDPAKVSVDEVSVATDERVDYVIVPPEGRGDASTPIATAHRDAERVEDVFKREAAESDTEDEESSDATPAS